MATLLEGATGLLGVFMPIFTALFVFAVMFALLERTKVFGNNPDRGRMAIISLVVAFMVLAIPEMTRLILTIVPWFFFVFLFILLVDVGFVFIGGEAFGDKNSIYSVLTKEGAAWFFIVIGAIIVALAAGHVFGQKLLPLTQSGAANATITNATGVATQTASSSFQQNLGATLFHPAIIGMFVFLIIATFAILFLTQADNPT